MNEGTFLSIATLLTAVVAVVQLYSTSRAASRQRDVELTRWGHSVIELMAELETACFPIVEQGLPTSERAFEKMAERGSALVDMGRLFFPNYQTGWFRRNWTELMCELRQTSAPRLVTRPHGLRVKVLDEVVRVTYIASHLASGAEADRKVLRAHVWQARKSFVLLLQQEMGSALRKVGIESAGDHVQKDPTTWPPPSRDLPYAYFRGEKT